MDYQLSWSAIVDLVQATASEAIVYIHQPESPAVLTSIATNSHCVESGALFIGLPGTRIDGGCFATQAALSGAKALVINAKYYTPHSLPNVPVIYLETEHVARVAGGISAYFYQNPTEKLRLVGVTGTNGKTTTTHIVEHILNYHTQAAALLGTMYQRWPGHQTPANFTTPFGADLQRTMAEIHAAECEFAVMEVSSHSLAQYRVAGCAFDVAVWTNLTQDHLDFHKTMEAYFEAKAQLFTPEYLGAEGAMVLNFDDTYGCLLWEKTTRLPNPRWVYTLEPNARSLPTNLCVQARILRMTSADTLVAFDTPAGQGEVLLPLVGKFNVVNAAAAVTACLSLDVPFAVICEALATCAPVPGRMRPVGTSDIHVLVDYAHTPDGLENALTALRATTTGKLWCVFGCGGDRDRTKRPLMGRVASSLADECVVTSDNPRTESPKLILQDICAGIPIDRGVVVQPNRTEAIRLAVLSASAGDTVLIAGKGHEDYQILGTEKIPFDDTEVAAEAVRIRTRVPFNPRA